MHQQWCDESSFGNQARRGKASSQFLVSSFEFQFSLFEFRFSSFHFPPSRCNISECMIETSESSLPPSKRAARRIIQRAFVLTGRDKKLRQHLREVRLTTLWILEDWDLVWTVIIDRGKMEFERRPAKHPDLTLTWRTAHEFFSCASLSLRAKQGMSHGLCFQSEISRSARSDRESALPESAPESVGNIEQRRVACHLLNSFLGHLGHVLRNPVDGAGESLL